MEIAIESLLEGAGRPTRTVSIIDVFRAFTSAAVALANGASKIVMVRSVEALVLRRSGLGQICIGEAGGGRGHWTGSNSAIRLSRSNPSTFVARPQSREPVLVPRAS